MTFTITTLAQSLAAYLAPVLPGVQMLEDPAQQGVKLPCMFLQQRSSDIGKRIGRRWERKIRLDLTYLLRHNLPDLQQQYLAAAEALDLCMESFPYIDGTETALLRTHDRKCEIDADGLHYKFELRVFVEQPETGVPMRTMQLNMETGYETGNN